MVPSDSRVVIIQTQSERQGTVAKPVKVKAAAAKPQHRTTASAVSFAESNTSDEDASDDGVRALGGYTESLAAPPKAPADWLQSQAMSQLSPTPSGTKDSLLHNPTVASMH